MKEIGLDEAKKIELEILNEFVEICKKNNLRYYLYAGTLIGAVRHKGFIPWDDDIDVSMPRDDYEKLKEVMGEKNYDGRYKLLTYENHGTHYNFMKVVDTRTVLYEKYFFGEIGIWIDIFPIDGLPDSYLLTRLLCMRLEFWRRLLNISVARPDNGTTEFRKKIKKIIQPIVKKIPVDYMCKKVNGTFVKYKFDTSKYVGAVSAGASYRARTVRENYDETYVTFEGYEYVAPIGTDILLTQVYGNYMELPPEEERIQHEFKAYWK
jgi:lipopolysaccharide cholinephosphotransferase